MTTILIPPRRPLFITQYILRAVPTHQIVNAAPRHQQKARFLRDRADTGDSTSPPLSQRDKDGLSTTQRPITAFILALVIFLSRLKHLQLLTVHVAFPIFLVHPFPHLVQLMTELRRRPPKNAPRSKRQQ